MSFEVDGGGALGAEGSSGFTVECKVRFGDRRRSRKRVGKGGSSFPAPQEPGRVPRVSRLMALAIRFEGLVSKGEVRVYAELAHLGHVSRARVTQIMNLLNLAPDIQEEILFLPKTVEGSDPIVERHVRPIMAEVNWAEQRRMWKGYKGQQSRVTARTYASACRTPPLVASSPRHGENCQKPRGDLSSQEHEIVAFLLKSGENPLEGDRCRSMGNLGIRQHDHPCKLGLVTDLVPVVVANDP
jgi:hypothetical protein